MRRCLKRSKSINQYFQFPSTSITGTGPIVLRAIGLYGSIFPWIIGATGQQSYRRGTRNQEAYNNRRLHLTSHSKHLIAANYRQLQQHFTVPHINVLIKALPPRGGEFRASRAPTHFGPEKEILKWEELQLPTVVGCWYTCPSEIFLKVGMEASCEFSQGLLPFNANLVQAFCEKYRVKLTQIVRQGISAVP